MKKRIYVSIILPAAALFALLLVTTPVAAQVTLTQDQYVFVNTYTIISGTSDNPPMMIDFPTYNFNSTTGTLTSQVAIPLTSDSKVIIGGGIGLSGGVGGGAATGLKLYDELSAENVFTVNSDSSLNYYIDGRWIALQKGILWTETFETTAYRGFTGQLVVTNRATYYGVLDKSNISAAITTPVLTPAVTPAATDVPPEPTPTNPGYRCGDVSGDGFITIVDALLIAQYYVGLVPASFNAELADVNNSGSIDIVDALLVARYYVGIPVSDVCF